ncbi:hypothetical protein [Erythrobacter sp. HL-111]|uniref:hypothetical protein n=1 Tax=Erythrobacter sp. HL-111 TaxID=1798193 RepID=UPI0006DA3E49|nr:hypothetical protein [Erythrobacter sp. HL-111]KPP94953.1 MAG: hypothetical protein HLUCCO15_02615 [Erythrobacteraceae bacterium HL-111]SDS15193.1 hypothetical protein SAMN04515621_1047 [Erythrobacter sp. HL-111]
MASQLRPFARRFPAIAGLAAALSLTAAPVSAAELPGNLVRPAASGSAFMADFGSGAHDAGVDTAEWGRCWGRWGCRGWRGRRGVRAGDVLAGAVIVGGIAAIASAAANNRRRERDVVIVERDRVRYDDRRYDDRRYDDRRYDDRRYDDRRYDTPRAAPRRSGASGLQGAVNMCLTEIERDVRVDGVDNVQRTAGGWAVTGTLFDGSSFLCSIGSDGRIDTIDFGGFVGRADRAAPARERAFAAERAERAVPAEQWSDVSYLRARASVEARDGFGPQPDEEMRVTLVTEPRDVEMAFAGTPADLRYAGERGPAYPGAPIPGEAIPDSRPIDGDLGR